MSWGTGGWASEPGGQFSPMFGTMIVREGAGYDLPVVADVYSPLTNYDYARAAHNVGCDPVLGQLEFPDAGLYALKALVTYVPTGNVDVDVHLALYNVATSTLGFGTVARYEKGLEGDQIVLIVAGEIDTGTYDIRMTCSVSLTFAILTASLFIAKFALPGSIGYRHGE